MAVKDACYKMMVRPIIEYAAIIWSSFTQSAIYKLESVQRKACSKIHMLDTPVHVSDSYSYITAIKLANFKNVDGLRLKLYYDVQNHQQCSSG